MTEIYCSEEQELELVNNNLSLVLFQSCWRYSKFMHKPFYKYGQSKVRHRKYISNRCSSTIPSALGCILGGTCRCNPVVCKSFKSSTVHTLRQAYEQLRQSQSGIFSMKSWRSGVVLCFIANNQYLIFLHIQNLYFSEYQPSVKLIIIRNSMLKSRWTNVDHFWFLSSSLKWAFAPIQCIIWRAQPLNFII